MQIEGADTLKLNSNSDPDPDPNPEPNPSPNPGPNPGPDPNPRPMPSPRENKILSLRLIICTPPWSASYGGARLTAVAPYSGIVRLVLL